MSKRPDSGTKAWIGWWAGTGAFPGVALAFLVLSGVFLAAAFQGPSALQWTGTPEHATYRGGIIYYTYHGQSYALSDRTSSTFHETTVFVDPSHPSDAILDNPFDRIFDVGSVTVPLVLAALFFALGLRRRQRRRAHQAEVAGDHTGRPMDEDLVEWLLDRQRRGI